MINLKTLHDFLSNELEPSVSSILFTKWNGSVISQVHNAKLGLQESPVGAVAASMWNQYSAFGRDIFSQKESRQLQIKCKSGVITMQNVFDYIVIIVSEKGTNTGLINLKIKHIAGWLREQLEQLEHVLTRSAQMTAEDV